MSSVAEQSVEFEKNDLAGQYQQISNFCVNYLEGLLVSLMYMEVPENLEKKQESYQDLQQTLIKRERTVRHAFQFQIEKRFKGFKSIGRSRLHTTRSSDWLTLGLAGQNSSRIQDIIETISDKHQKHHKTQLINLDKRMKSLVHRADASITDNPLSPNSLCDAFLASIETLNLTSLKTRQLFELFDLALDQHLVQFYIHIDTGMYDLDLLPELSELTLFSQPSKIKTDKKNALKTSDEATNRDDEQHILSKHHALKQLKSNKQSAATLDQELQKLKQSLKTGSLDYVNLLSNFDREISSLVDEKQKLDIEKFLLYYTSLLDNKLLNDPLRLQLSRLSYPLLELVLIDPFFFRSSSHPVNDFLQSIIDFEIRHKHQHQSLSCLTELIDELIQLDKPVLSDFQPIIDRYETFKQESTLQLQVAQEKKKQDEALLRKKVLELINQITERLNVENETLTFFYDDWQLLLFQVGRKIGLDSNEFHQSVEIIKMLAWVLDSNKSEDKSEYQKHSFTSLLKAIDKGLRSLNFSSEHRHRVRKQLLKEFKKNNNKTNFSVIAQNPTGSQGLGQFSSFFGQLGSRLTDIHIRSANNPGQTQQGTLSDQLELGAWVEIRADKFSKYKRAKLKWKSADDSLFIFIDQRGHKIKECDAKILDEEYNAENIKLLNNPAPFSQKQSTLGHGFKCYIR